MPTHTVSLLLSISVFPSTCMMHKEFCNSDFYSSLFREVARGRLRSVHADTTIHNHFFSDLLLQILLFTHDTNNRAVLTSVQSLVLEICIDM